MSPFRWIAVGALLGALGVALGAYGAHGLEKQLAAWGFAGDELAKRLANHETAVRYQMWHALAIVRSIVVTAKNVRVTLASGKALAGDHVMLTAPPPLWIRSATEPVPTLATLMIAPRP